MRHLPIVLLALGGCASDAGFFNDPLGRDFDDADTDGSTPNSPSDTAWGEPEDEVDRLQLAPAQTDAYVFIANPERDTVTRVHVASQAVRTTRVGRQPRVVQISPDYTTAAVLNLRDDSVSIIDAESLEQDVVGVRDNMNAMVMSPDGAWLVLWHDVGAERPDDPPGGDATSFNEISLVDISGRSHFPMVVGFNPKDVTFTPDGSLALVVADASLASVRLDAGDPVPELVQVADPLSPPVAEEVIVVPDGSYAFVRQRGTDALTIVDLVTREVTSVPVGANPTDLDLSPDGLSAIVVSRGAHEVSVFDVADPFQPPRVVPYPSAVPLGAVIVGPDDSAILYTTASPTARYATWNLLTDEIVMRPLAKPLVSLARTPTGSSLLAVHTESNNVDGTTPEPYRDVPAISLIDLGDFRANTIALTAPVSGFANSNDGVRGYLILEDQPSTIVIDYRTLIFDELSLRSNPVFIGVLPDLDFSDADEPPAWISQQHDLGRLSFYDPDDGTLETITGFELNGAIED